ncbi:MAG: S8 family peptidase, partial [Vicinamibacterales bacterium]
MESLQLKVRRRGRGPWPTWHGSTALLVAVVLLATAPSALASGRRARLSSDLVAHLNSSSSAPVDLIVSGSQERIERLARRHGLTVKKRLTSGAVLTASRSAVNALAQDGEIDALSGDPVVRSHMALTTKTTGADAAWSGAVATLGAVNGRGIGVAIIDSGIADHPALKDRVVASVDFTSRRGRGRDDYGHGTHIAGIIAARSFNRTAEGAEQGMAPAAHLISLKVLGADGSGQASDVIEAIDWAIRYRKSFGIRVLNLSLGAAPTQSYRDDPICQAVERAVKAGLVVVASAGNYGTNEKNQQIYGSVTSPGISPYAITVGAIRTQGTADKADDEVAPWSSKGPTMVDKIVKPDLVAPGSQIISTAARGAQLMQQFPDRLINGPGSRDYFSMSGTSMSAAVVTGAVALLLDGRGDLTPLQVKLALQASADFMPSA